MTTAKTTHRSVLARIGALPLLPAATSIAGQVAATGFPPGVDRTT